MNSVLVINIIVITIFLDYLTAKPYHIKDGDVDVLVIPNNETGNYEFHIYEEDSKKQETGKIVKTKQGNDVLQVKGSYYYETAMGNRDTAISVNYTADENGFRASIKTTSKGDGDDDRIGKDCLASLCGG
ncbi:hypothetical protein ILUMI_03003 [Ignelater luminosus]|uniref:Uncharacterized protein n=1 Tax=Ignelater luminosus TaxID=2038154 RepID=A0A8K0DGN1_IGNLU|nr:hypothetical protein ILUMI_03003 [Ignelater luminosus]